LSNLIFGCPLVRAGGLVVAHNMRSPSPEPKFISAITTNPGLETTFINMNDQGVSLTVKKL